MKTFRKILFYTFLSLTVVMVAVVISVFLFKDKIIQQFINEANKHLNTPVKVSKIDVSVFEDFPRLSIVLTEVYVEDSHPGIYPLLMAKKISFQLDALEIWNDQYTIKGLSITDSETVLKKNENGETNFQVIKKSEGTGNNGKIQFELKNVVLINSKVRYVDLVAHQDLNFNSTRLKASITSDNNQYMIQADGSLFSEKLIIDKVEYLTNKSFEVKADLIFDDNNSHLQINPSNLLLGKSEFEIKGTYEWKTKNLIDLQTNGKNTDIQTLLTLLPSSVAKGLEKYQSDGDVYFRSKLKGETGKRKSPFFSVEFGFNNATIYHPGYGSKIEKASLTGSFASTDLLDPTKASLILKDFKGVLNNEQFEANLIINDFNSPEVICNFKGKLDAASVQSFYPVEGIKDMTGSLVADVSLEGKIDLLKNKATAQRVSTQGTIDLKDINFTYGKEATPVEQLNGSLQFSNNDLALSNVKGKFGNSDFLLNGFFKNIITFLLFENQPIGIETDLKSQYIDLEQLFSIGFTSGEENADYKFSISKNLYFNFNCNIASLHYKKFKARNIKGDLLVKNEVAVSRQLTFSSMGGNISLSGILDAQNPKAIDLLSTIKIENVNADSAFYVFENFQQDFIQSHHLKGKANADINLDVTLDEKLKFYPETLIGDVSFVIKNGELNNFEPLKKLSKYVDEDDLGRLKFSDLKNEIHIEKSVVYIPEMDIRSNITQLKISGTHTFDQVIDYRIVTPLRRKKIVDVNAQGAIDNSMDGQTKLFLKITGTTDDYKIGYDTEAVKKKIGNDIKREVQELRDAFRSKDKKKQKELELEKEEYFEWDN